MCGLGKGAARRLGPYAFILGYLGGQGLIAFPAASRVCISESLCENPKTANRVPTGG